MRAETFSLFGWWLGCPLDMQRSNVLLGIIAQLFHPSTVNHVSNAGNGDWSLCAVRGKHDLPHSMRHRLKHLSKQVSNTHTHPCNGPLTRTTQVSRKVKPIWILLKQETVSGSGISWAMCKSGPCSRQTAMPAPHHSVFLQAGCPSCRPTNSVKALKASEKYLFANNNHARRFCTYDCYLQINTSYAWQWECEWLIFPVCKIPISRLTLVNVGTWNGQFDVTRELPDRTHWPGVFQI